MHLPILRTSLFVALIACGAATAAQLTVHVRAAADASECLRDAPLLARSLMKRGQEARVETWNIPHSLTLRGDGPWAVAIAKAGCWTGESVWNLGDDPTLSLRVYKEAAVRGAFSKTARPPSALRATVYPRRAASSDGERVTDGVATQCSISESQWECAVPADHSFDLRLEPPGFATVYYWDVVAANATPKQLEECVLTPGASVAGWIVGPKDTPIRDARITVFPLDALDSTEATSRPRLYRARTDRRGFFQVTGLPPARYRLVSETARLSPLVVADIPVREAESVVLPKTLRHASLGELEIVLEPPADPSGKAWAVELRQATTLYPGRKVLKIARSAAADGLWNATDIPEDRYVLEVRNYAGSVVTRREVDVFGERSNVLVSVPNIVIHGMVKLGDDGLKTRLNLASSAGELVKVETGHDGTFRATLPAAGKWFPTILHPPGESPARIRAAPIVIPEQVALDGEPHEVVVQLPGGRIHGVVESRQGVRGRAAVHARRDGRLEAQQMADERGAFDLVGLPPGVYELDAQSAAGSTREPVRVEIGDDEEHEVTLTTEPYVRLSGVVLTPSGRPASGAMVQISQDGGRTWRTELAAANGGFRHELHAGAKDVQLVVVTYEYPSAILSFPVTEDLLEIRLRSDGGLLRFIDPRTAHIVANGVSVMAPLFYYPRPPGQHSGGVHVQSGDYVVCSSSLPKDQCRAVHVSPGSDQTVELGTSPKSAQTQ